MYHFAVTVLCSSSGIVATCPLAAKNVGTIYFPTLFAFLNLIGGVSSLNRHTHKIDALFLDYIGKSRSHHLLWSKKHGESCPFQSMGASPCHSCAPFHSCDLTFGEVLRHPHDEIFL